MKKLFAMLLALAMVMGLSMTAFAVEGDTPPAASPEKESFKVKDYPQDTDKVNVKIGELTGDPTVTLYQIASANYNNTEGSKGFIDYVWKVPEIDFGSSTSDQITKIANYLVAGNVDGVTGKTDAGTIENGTYTANVKAGVYIAVITGADDGTVYNPVLLTATYARTQDGNTALEGGVINVKDAHYLNGLSAVAKKSAPSIDKEITDETNDTNSENNAIHTVSVGDTVSYKITPTMPSYPADAVNKALAISDRPSVGLDFQLETLVLSMQEEGAPTVSCDDEKGADGNVTLRVFSMNGSPVAYAKPAEGGFNMTFVYDKLIYGTNGAVYTPVVEYKAVVTDDAVVGSGTDNTATLYYTNQPNTEFDYDPSTGDYPEGEGIETKDDKAVVYTYQLAFHKVGNANDDEKGLAGAQFGIYSDEDCTELVDIVTTAAGGYAVSSKVGKGTYYIKEIKAPAGYSLNTNVYTVEANWKTATKTTSSETTKRVYTANENEAVSPVQVGWLDSNNVFYNMDTTVDTEGMSEAYLKSETTTAANTTLTESNPGAGTVASIKFDGKDVNSIQNDTLTALPSTGGMGTMIFTVAGCLIMIVAAGFYFSGRKKSAAK